MFQQPALDLGLGFLSYLPSRKHPILYNVGILITNANISSMKVFRAL